MQLIKLRSGTTVEMVMTAQSVLDVNNYMKFNILDVDKEGNLERLLDSQLDLVNVMYLLCEEDCKKQNVSDIDFGRGMGGEHIRLATEQFLDELKDFLPLQKRVMMTHTLKVMAEVQADVMESAIARMEGMKEGIRNIMNKEMDKKLTLQNLENTFAEQKQS